MTQKTLFLRYFKSVVLAFICLTAISTFARDPSELRLIPFPKQVTLDEEQEFSLNTPLQLYVSSNDEPLLTETIVAELKRAGFNAPKRIDGDFGEMLVILAAAETPVDDVINSTTLPNEAGEGKSDVDESYAITVTPKVIVCLGKGETGLFYAVQTLCQLIRANVSDDGMIPCMTIRDWPSMKYRCFQDDLSRGPSPHLETLFKEFDLGASLKHNMFTYYMEDQFELKKHPKIWPKNGSLLQEEFEKSIDYADRRHLIMLGCLQSFAHHEKILAIPEYAHLGEAGYILSPTVEEVYSFLDERYSEMLPLLPFEMFAACCDETWDLAKSGPSKELAEKIGVGGVYVQHLLRVHALLKKYGKRMLLSGDIIIQHPEKLDIIPKDIVMMCWNYTARPDFEDLIKPFAESGYDVFVCPGQSNWSVILPLINQYVINIKNFVRDGCKYGVIGMINTGWEDDGEAIHGYNWHAIAWGAECSWNASKTEITDFNKRVGSVLFGVKGDEFGRAIERLAELQEIPELGGAYNVRFWQQDFIPNQVPAVIEKKSNRILELVESAIADLETTKKQATVNAELLDSFLLGARRLQLIATRMLDGLEVSRRYSAASELDLTVPEQKKNAVDELEAIEKIIDKNRNLHRVIEKEFVRIWNSESKPFSLDLVTKKYDKLDDFFAGLANKVQNLRKSISNGSFTGLALPDIGIVDSSLTYKIAPKVLTNPLSPDTPWGEQKGTLRLGLTVEAGNVDRKFLPVELDITLPESYRDKITEAWIIGEDAQELQLIPSQLNITDVKNKRRLVLLIPELPQGKTAKIHVYFGMDQASVASKSLPRISTHDTPNGMKVIENDVVQISLGAEGGHAYKWLVKDFDNRDITDPGEVANKGFCDHGHIDRSKCFDLVCMAKGPAMVRYGCFSDGELVKTLTVYPGLPIIDVILSHPVNYYWDFDKRENFADDGQTQGVFLFSDGQTGAMPPLEATANLQTRVSKVSWVVKFNKQRLALGMTTPEGTSNFVVGPGGDMGGVGIESFEGRSHFVTFAGMLGKNTPEYIMNTLSETYNLKNQPTVTLYAFEKNN